MLITAKYYLLVFAILTIVGGVMGYIKAESMPSLIAGGISGLLLLVSFFLLPGKPLIGLALGCVIALALAGRFLPSFMSGGGFMPAGLMSILSVIGVIITAIAFFKR